LKKITHPDLYPQFYSEPEVAFGGGEKVLAFAARIVESVEYIVYCRTDSEPLQR
jgi:hypothetical protein